MEAIDTLAGGIARQFNNALTGITGNVDLLGMYYPNNDEIAAFVKPMKDSANRMARLTKQLLAYAKEGKCQSKIISMSDFVRDSLPLLEQPTSPFIDIDADLPQMQMVLSAVLSNASEAIEGKGRIRIACSNEIVTDETADKSLNLNPGPVCENGN
jgi:signal transduction histidine kinase